MKTVSQNSDQVFAAAPQPSFTPARGQSSDTVFEPLLDAPQAAQLLGGMHVKTLQRLARSHDIPGYQIGRFWYFRASELNTWLDTMRSANPSAWAGKRNSKCPRG